MPYRDAETRRRYALAYRRAHKAEAKKASRAWYEKHRALTVARASAWRKANKIRYASSVAKRQATEKHRAYQRNYARKMRELRRFDALWLASSLMP